jgi:hypothetical protein
MKSRLGTIAAVTLCLALLPALLPLSVASSLSGTPQPCNADFENGFRPYDDLQVLTVANNWDPWYVEDDPHHRPEYQPERIDTASGRVYHGTYAQKQFTRFATHDGGIYQRIEGITRGKWYTFSAWVYVWSSDHGDPDISAGPRGKYSALVGINPWGDCRATYRTTVWGKEAVEVYDQWVQVSVTAQAWSDAICVFTRGTAEWAVRNNESYWDALTFVEVPGPQPQPTYTPYPTYTPQPAPTCPTPDKSICPSLEEIRLVVREELAKQQTAR